MRAATTPHDVYSQRSEQLLRVDAEVDLYSAALAAIEVAGAAAFSYIAALLARVYSRLPSEEVLGYVVAFALLAASQVAAAASALANDPRTAATLYSATSSLAAASFIVMLASREPTAYALAPTVIVSTDFAAGLLSSLALSRLRGKARLFAALLSASYYGRAVSSAIAPDPASETALILSELFRAAAATGMSMYYAAAVSRGAEEEQA
ncbi:MAG: hypothetical protein ABWW70_00655 [Thermoproteota archaeon]